MITVRVPATSANLGPGFDCMGIALGLYGYLTFEERESGLTFENVDPRYCTEDNLAVRAYRKTIDKLGLPQPGLFVRIGSEIPVSRGLGSSASLIVGGIAAANAAHGDRLSRAEMLTLATELEGHPDNVAPALAGGLTVSLTERDGVYSMPCAVAENVRFCVLVPDFELETRKARAVLPKEVPFADACFNVSRAAVLLKALEAGDPAGIGAAMRDRLHQPYREALIDGYAEMRSLAFECGAAAFCLSGAGPTLLCVYVDEVFGERMREAMSALNKGWRVLTPDVDRTGAVVVSEG